MAPALDPMVGRYLRLAIDGVAHRLYFEEAGSEAGIPLVCLHTAGADNRQFRHLLADPEVEAVIIATSEAFHVPAARRAMEAGKPFEHAPAMTYAERFKAFLAEPSPFPPLVTFIALPLPLVWFTVKESVLPLVVIVV